MDMVKSIDGFCRYDFFIVSQSVNQGTVAPTHYHVLRDNSKFSVNIMQRLTYKLCHLYYNWPVCMSGAQDLSDIWKMQMSVISDVRRTNCLENYIFFRKISSAFFRKITKVFPSI